MCTIGQAISESTGLDPDNTVDYIDYDQYIEFVLNDKNEIIAMN